MACQLCHRAFPSTSAGWSTASTDIVEQPTPNRCTQVACMACGTVQCHGNGSARGACRECRFGMLPGWSGNAAGQPCRYRGCPNPAVYLDLPGGKARACKVHGDRILERRFQSRVK